MSKVMLDAVLTQAPPREDLVVDAGQRFSSQEVESRVRALASALMHRGTKPGHRVAFQLPIGVDSVVAYRACWRVGAVAVALHPASGSDHLARALDQCQPFQTIADPDFPLAEYMESATLDELISEAPQEDFSDSAAHLGNTALRATALDSIDQGNVVQSNAGQDNAGQDNAALDDNVLNTAAQGSAALGSDVPGNIVLGDAALDSVAVKTIALDDDASDSAALDSDALVLYTSGSTGMPRGVVHTHRSLVYKVDQLIKVHGLTSEDSALVPTPLAHAAGLLHGVLIPGTAGMKTVLMTRWDPGAALELIERESVTYMVGPPTLFLALMDHPKFNPARVASLRLVSCGGAGVTPSFCRRASETLGAVVKRSYGSTEALTISTSRFDDPPDKMINTDGRAFGSAWLRVDDAGELWVTGTELARGYLDAEDTARSFVDGWFRTGDLAVLDDGWVTISGRLGNRIIRAGENISADEVERHLEAHPSVRQAAVVAEPHRRLGERVAAFVVAPGGFDLDTCRDWFARRGAASYITPERIEVVEDLPLLATGKVDRAQLRNNLKTQQPNDL